jgi:predicted XRE-type DNA-binding protein
MTTSLFARVASDQAELSLLILKSKLWSVLTKIITDRELTQKKAAELLKVSQPRVSNMMKGQLEKFSMDFFIESLTRLGYKLDMDFTPHNEEKPLSIYVKKAAL